VLLQWFCISADITPHPKRLSVALNCVLESAHGASSSKATAMTCP
jgi:hypothetical protein